MGNDWYYAREGEQAGPVSATELKRLASSGRLHPEDLIWQEGMKEWTPARQVKGLFEASVSSAALPPAAPPVAAVSAAATATGPGSPGPRHALDYFLDLARRLFGPPFIQATSRLFLLMGHWGLALAMVAALVWSVAVAIKADRMDLVPAGMVCLACLVVVQYWGRRLPATLPPSARQAPGRIASPGALECLAVVAATGGLLSLAALTMVAVNQRAWLLILPGMACFILGQYTAILALNPQALGMSVDRDASATDEALALLGWIARAMLQLAPVAFGVGATWTCAELIYACCGLFFPEMAWHGPGLATGPGLVLTALGLLLAPAWAYLAYLGCQLLAETLDAILSLPSKLPAGSRSQGRADDEA